MSRISLLLEDAPAWQPVPVKELSTFDHWPFHHVVSVETDTVMRRGHKGTFLMHEEPVLVHDFSRHYMYTPYSTMRVPILGNWTNGIPITIKVHTPDMCAPFWIFRHHYYCWKLNWMMGNDQWNRFKPAPYIRHDVVEDFLTTCKTRGIYQPHEKETRWFPKTWRGKTLPKKLPILGEHDLRWKGAFPSLYTGNHFQR